MKSVNDFDVWDACKNVLCIRLDNMGDVLMMTPALRALKAATFDRRLTLLASGEGAKIARLIPEIDAILEFNAPWVRIGVHEDHDGDAVNAMVQRIAEREFDAAVIMCSYSQNPLPAAFLCHLAKIPLRIGYCRENPYRLLTHWVPDPEPGVLVRHEVQRQLDLVAQLTAEAKDTRLSLQIPPEDRLAIHDILAECSVDLTEPILLVHPGASAASRRYPSHLFAEAIRRLFLATGYQIILTGSDSEVDLADTVYQRMNVPALSLAGRLSIGQFAALTSLSSLLISNNTLAVHVAAAVQTPVVVLYALTNPQHTPWQVPHRVLFHDVPCKYCYKSSCPQQHHQCLTGVPPEAVVDAALTLLSGNRLKEEKDVYLRN